MCHEHQFKTWVLINFVGSQNTLFDVLTLMMGVASRPANFFQQYYNNLEHILWEEHSRRVRDCGRCADPMVAVAVLILDGRLDSLPKVKY